MKKFFQTIGLFALICFSFFYTEKTITVLNEQDPLMIEIQTKKDNYYLKPQNAIINNDEIIPGIKGKIVNVEKTYENMKKKGFFNEKLIIYDTINPEISLNNNYSKYITKGNNNKDAVSLVFIIDSEKYLDDLITIAKQKKVTFNLFMTTNYLNNHISKLYDINNNEIYNYANDGEYKNDLILLGNNIINRNTKNTAKYCLSKTKNRNNLDICSKNKMYTILPTKIINNEIYSNIKTTLNKGDIILLEVNNNLIKQLDITIDFIGKKGLAITGLSHLLTEENF